jgi:hypothetical protein
MQRHVSLVFPSSQGSDIWQRASCPTNKTCVRRFDDSEAVLLKKAKQTVLASKI